MQSTSTLERLPVPRTSPAGSSVFSEMLNNGDLPCALRDAVKAGKIPAADLPELIAYAWTRYDSPTSGVSEADWVLVFRQAGFFSYPPIGLRLPDGTLTPLRRPSTTVTLYRGSTAERMRRMSWTYERAAAELLGRRHTRYGAAALYMATVNSDAILAYLERRAEGWTVIIDPAGLTDIEPLADIRDPTAMT